MRTPATALIFVTIVAVLLTAPARADFADGEAAYDNGDFEAARKEWLRLAEAGVPDAQYRLGLQYKRGEGVSQNYQKSVQWLTMAATRDHVGAILALGKMFAAGEGLLASEDRADCLIRVAAYFGNAEAMFIRYWDLKKIPKKQSTADEFLSLAASLGHAAALYEKGWLLFLDPKITDKRMAFFYMLVAKKQGDPDADGIIQSRLQMRGAKGADELDRAETAAAFWQPMKFPQRTESSIEYKVCLPLVLTTGPALADNIAADALFEMGHYSAVIRIRRLLAETGDAWAQFGLGEMYRDGKGVPPDILTAASWFRQAALQSHPKALIAIAHMYKKQMLPKGDANNAECLIGDAAQIGDADAQWAFYQNWGYGKSKDEIALKILDRAAAQGHAAALKEKGLRIFRDRLIREKRRAYYYLHLADRQGDTEARKIIQERLDRYTTDAAEDLAWAKNEAADWRPKKEIPVSLWPRIISACIP